MRDITQELQALAEGHSRATDELLVVVYEELRQLAARKMASDIASSCPAAFPRLSNSLLPEFKAEG
jgi:hypothetical protein